MLKKYLRKPVFPARVSLLLAVLIAASLLLGGWGWLARAAAVWSEPELAWQEQWADPKWFDINDDASRMVALSPYSGGDDNSRQVWVTEKVAGVWQEPQLLAANGVFSDESFQVLPQETIPVMSGDGSTIAYLGYTGSGYGVYIADRQAQGWGTPQLLYTDLPNHHYWISLSRDGNTLALCNYPYFGVQYVYLLTRAGGLWSAPQQLAEGGMPSLSADGAKITYIWNARVMFAEKTAGVWSAPQMLTSNDGWQASAEYPQISADGKSIHYWLVTLVEGDGVYIRVAQDLYQMRRTADGWSVARKVNAAPLLPGFVTEGPAVADEHATRLIYTRPVTTTGGPGEEPYVHASHLEVSELGENGWQETRLVEVNGWGNYNSWPRLTPDGKNLLFYTSRRQVGPPADELFDVIWQMSTDQPPPPLLVTSALIGPGGGSLYSPIDDTGYVFAPGVFSSSVVVTHTFLPVAAPPPAGWWALGRAFEVTAVYSSSGQPAQPAQPVTITIGYTPEERGAAIPGSLCLWWMGQNGWLPLESLDDPAAGRLSARIEHFSTYAVFGKTQQLFLPIARR